jgi:hypothetical protein
VHKDNLRLQIQIFFSLFHSGFLDEGYMHIIILWARCPWENNGVPCFN